jgi:uncharacterized membrane protein YphA (DoxX/SURF4 family)
VARLAAWLFAPQPVERLELLRILLPLAILGFLSTRIAHIDHLLSMRGYQVPDLGHPDWRQPMYLSPLDPWQAWVVGALIVVSALATSLGALTRVSSGVLAFLLAYVALANRIEAFTVNKLGAALMIALFLSPAGARYSIDAWRARRAQQRLPRKRGRPPPTEVVGGSVRFFQIAIVVMYAASGIAKMHGDWLSDPLVIWSHMHDSYQSAFAYFLARHVPAIGWTVMQGATLGYEFLAPLWYGWARTRRYALYFGLGMHLTIALLFPPVMWFSLLMMAVIFAGYAPAHWLRSGEPAAEPAVA